MLFGGGGGTLAMIRLRVRGVGRAPLRAAIAALWLAETIALMASLLLAKWNGIARPGAK